MHSQNNMSAEQRRRSEVHHEGNQGPDNRMERLTQQLHDAKSSLNQYAQGSPLR